jgi:hypothetical protein
MNWHDWVDIRAFLFSFGDMAFVGFIMWVTNRRKGDNSKESSAHAKRRDVR